MIGYLRGLVIEHRGIAESAVELIIDVGGVGYRVLVPPRLASAAVNGDSEITLSVHTHMREGAVTLYGFACAEERQAFELLIGAHGVGPSLALAIVSVHSPQRLAEVVGSDDLDALMLVPGVGRKTATRILVELRTRLDQFDTVARPAATGRPAESVTSDVQSALAQLGYGPDEVREVLRELPREGSAEHLLRTALRQLAAKR